MPSIDSPLQNNSYRCLHLGGSTAILLLATVLSVLALHHARRWHPDEAFYMTIARNAAVQGDWMLISEPLDKPPLTYYINALSLKFLAVDSDANGVLFLDVYKGEFAGRIASLLMSVLLVAVVMSITSSLTRNPSAVFVSGLLAALSPLRIVFAPTAFTDMPMLVFATLSLLMVVRGKWGWAGVWFMVSFAAKPQCIFYLPLLVTLTPPLNPLTRRRGGDLSIVWAFRLPLSTNEVQWRGGWGVRFIMPILIGGIILFLWDAARVNMGTASFWALGQAYYTPTTITPFADYPARIRELWATVQYLFGHGVITAILLLIGIFHTLWRRRATHLMLLGWLLGFVVLHIVLTLNLFDRNLLLMVPVACVLVAVSRIGRDISRPYYNLTPASLRLASPLQRIGEGIEGRGLSVSPLQIILFISMLIFSVASAYGIYPIGGDDGRHNGIDELADYLNSKPVATVIYDRWLDWELDYYMGEWTNKRRVYYPTPQELVEGALQLDETGVRYFDAPTSQDVMDWLDALENVGFTISLDYESDNFQVYSLYPP